MNKIEPDLGDLLGATSASMRQVGGDHYKNLANPNNVMSANVPITMANSFPTDISANDGSLEIYYNGALENACILVSDILCDNVNDNYFAFDFPYSEHDIQSCYTFDQSKTGISRL